MAEKNEIDEKIEAICIQLGCPPLVFKGSEQAELVSHDYIGWNDRLRAYRDKLRRKFEQNILDPRLDEFLAMTGTPNAKQELEWKWDDETPPVSDDLQAKPHT